MTQESDQKLTLIFVHGYGTNSTTWQLINPMIRDKYNCHFIDLIGFGPEPPPKEFDYSVRSWARQLGSFVTERVRNGNFAIVAHSLGCGVALSAYLDKLITPSFMVLVDPLAYRQPVPSYLRVLTTPYLGSIVAHIVPARLQLNQAFNSIYFEPDNVIQSLKNSYLDLYRIPHYVTTLRRSVLSLRDGGGSLQTSRYSEIENRLYLVRGKQDTVIPLKSYRRLRNEFAFQGVFELDECGHAPHEERPVEFYEIIARICEVETDE